MGVNRYKQRDAVLRDMGYESYDAYLRSPLWGRIRARLFKNCDTCVCGEPATQFHHRSYKRRYLEGRGKIYKFIVPLCRKCHQSIEFDERGKTPLGTANARLDAISGNRRASGRRHRSRKRSRVPQHTGANANAKPGPRAAARNGAALGSETSDGPIESAGTPLA